MKENMNKTYHAKEELGTKTVILDLGRIAPAATPAATTSGAAGTIDTPMWRELLSQAGAAIPDDFNCTTYPLSALVRFSDKHTAAAVAAAREEGRREAAQEAIAACQHEQTVHVPEGGRAYRVPPEVAAELARLRAAPVVGEADHFRSVVANVCEGWNISADLRKYLETALFTAPTAQPTPPGDERAAFEDWHQKGKGRDLRLTRYESGEYVGRWTQDMWEAWQARATLRQPGALLDWIKIDGDTTIIHGVRYSNRLLEDFGKALPAGQPLLIESREPDGALCVVMLDWAVVDGPGALPDGAEDAARLEWIRANSCIGDALFDLQTTPRYGPMIRFPVVEGPSFNEAIDAARAAAATKEK